MNITIVAVGKLKEKFWEQAAGEYLKRLKAYAKVTVKEIPDVDPGRAGGIEAARDKEGEAVLAAIPERSHVILLAIEGKETSSVALSRYIDELGVNGKSDITFVIGGSDGSSPAVYKRANHLLSFGPITLPHNLARIVLLEQIYRSFRISRGEPYHK
ncbi:MAG: 23S rRNA (pseudouridine(1915)-N(3))-methyltransferase RlmH [Lachnospiraceae bacterium]|nr:23S rRNA (pseudouridine(1915)-N(3))-methyltransferase RlmH [Lachnospiraceae bacterium]